MIVAPVTSLCSLCCLTLLVSLSLNCYTHFISKLSSMSSLHFTALPDMYTTCMNCTKAKNTPPKSTAPSWNNVQHNRPVNWARNISGSLVQIWTWTDLWEKKGITLDEFTRKTLLGVWSLTGCWWNVDFTALV